MAQELSEEQIKALQEKIKQTREKSKVADSASNEIELLKMLKSDRELATAYYLTLSQNRSNTLTLQHLSQY